MSRHSVWRSILQNGFWMPLFFQDTALPAIAIPAAVAGLAPGDHVRALALIIALMSLVSMVVPPLAGGISDALTRRGIPRRVPIWIGAALDVASLLMLAQVHTLPLFMTFVLLATMGANISLAAYQALIPDVVPKDAWGTASGIRSVAMLIGTILGFGVAAGTPPPTTFIGVAVAIGVGALVLLAESEHPAPAQEEHAHISDWHDFTVVFIARAFLAFGLALLMTFVLYYFRDILRVGNPSVGTALVGVASLAGAIISSLYLGWLSDRVPRKIVVAVCGIPMALAAAGFAITPEAHLMYAYALLFGIGFGGIMSTGWALAIDSVPKLRDVARDLGIWGIAQNFPQVIAPLTGGAVLAAYGYTQMGYRVLFFVAAGSFALGSVTVLAVGKRPIIPWWGNPLRIASAITLGSYLRLRYRIRSWGALPKRRGPALVISNHQIEMDLMHPMATFVLRGGFRTPVLTASAKLMYEPGYFALRIPWLWRLFHNVNLGWLFEAMGMLPLENELQLRTIARWAWGVERRHGEQPLEAVFKPSVITTHRLTGLTTRDLFKTRHFKTAQSAYVRLSELLPAYRKEAMDDMRAGVEADLRRIEGAMALGATFYVTPEGEYPSDGAMRPFRGIWDRLAPQADAIYLAAISYDPFSARKLSQLYRIVRLNQRDRVIAELQAARPVTISALLAEWLTLHAAPFTEEEAAAAIRERLRRLPRELFVDPELAREPSRLVVQAIRHLRDVGIVRAVNGTLMVGPHRRHPEFPQTDDIIAYQARFFAETLRGAGIISGELHASEAMRPKASGLPA